ncbi:MAG: cyclic nucleotide-gated ion channel [Beijerinckiaceae bacterium]
MNLAAALRLIRFRRRVYELLDGGLAGDRLAGLVHAVLVTLVLISVAAVILESVPSVDARFGRAFVVIELVAAAVFSAEYALRLWACVEHGPLKGLKPSAARWQHALSPAMVVDLIAILPFFLMLVLPDDLKVLLIFRLIRFFKLARYSPGMRSLQEAIYEERRALLACLVILCGVMIVAAAAMHMVEASAQPEKFGSIPDAMWWAIITLTTVGYGDVFPITPAGKLVASVTALCGLVMLALPVGIIATSFSEVIRRREFVITWSMVSQTPIFAHLEPHVLGEIISMMHSQMAEEGETIYRKRDAGDRLFVIGSGAVELTGTGRRRVLGAGDAFGEDAVLRGGVRLESARATSRTRLLALHRADMLQLVERDPEIGKRLAESSRQPERGLPGS